MTYGFKSRHPHQIKNRPLGGFLFYTEVFTGRVKVAEEVCTAIIFLEVGDTSKTVHWTVFEDRHLSINMLLVGENSNVSQTNFVCLPDSHSFSASLLLAALPRGVTAR